MLEIKVYGNYGLFTSHESIPERFTYEVITPSASKGIFESIYWKPQFTWKIREIQVLNEINFMSFKRNEVKSRMSTRSKLPYLSIQDDRTQKNNFILVKPTYIIRASIIQKPDDQAHINKHIEIFNRRLQSGQCFRQPYFGCKEYVAYFEPPSGNETIHDSLKGTIQLDRMLHSTHFQPGKKTYFSYYSPTMVNGLIKV